MPFIILVTPFFSENAVLFLQTAVNQPDFQVALVSQPPQENLSPSIRNKLVGHWRVDNALDAAQLEWAVRGLMAQHGKPFRLFGAMEQIQVQLAEVRTKLGIPGMSIEAATNFRDKARMKDIFRANGIPCARHRQVESAQDAWDFAREIGYPLVIKPLAGAGSQTTFRIESDDDMRRALAEAKPSAAQAAIAEEFITGQERSFETITLGGKHVWHSLTHYLPAPLDAMRNAWIQWCLLLPREIDVPEYDDIRAMGTKAIEVLGIETGLTHMEWFRRNDGSIAISEVAARPPGAQLMTMMSRANDIDFIAAWLRVMVFGEFTPPERKYAVGGAFLRGQGPTGGRVASVRGLDIVDRELGHLICDFRLPEIGQVKSISYEGEGYILLRHPETAVVTAALNRIISTVYVEIR